MTGSGVGKARGVLNPGAGEGRFRLSRTLPSDDLAFFVEHYWVVRWDLRGRDPYRSDVLPHPCVHLAIEKGGSRVYGVVRERFSRFLSDAGTVFGVKFRPGAFYPFWGSPVSGLTGGYVDLRDAFGAEGVYLEKAVLSAGNDREMAGAAEAFLRRRLPARDENIETVNRAVDLVAADRTVVRVEDVAVRCAVSTRTLQRLFERYVGVGPKWVIRRYRLHEATDRLAAGTATSLAALALELGYFDQAHFAKDFAALVGVTPAEYAKEQVRGLRGAVRGGAPYSQP